MSKCALYRHFDASGVLLYVGISKNAVCRLGGHKGSSWYDRLASMTVDHFDTRTAAADAERQAIQSENPVHNKMRYPSKPVVESKRLVNAPETPPEQLWPAGNMFLRMHIAWRDVEGVINAGGDPYVL